MFKSTTMLCAATSLAIAGCNGRGLDSTTNNAEENAAAGPQGLLCAFDRSDTKDWSGKANADQSVSVTGKVHVSNSKYRAALFNPQVQGSVARVYLTQAENHTGQSPADGWWDVPYTIADNGSIQTVEVWCDMDTKFADFPVRRGVQPASAPAATEVSFQGCPILRDVEGGCLVVKTGTETYDINSAQPRPDPAKGLVIDGTGTPGGVSICMTGKVLTNVKWHYTKSKCPIGEGKQ
jgi:hypothetical protein